MKIRTANGAQHPAVGLPSSMQRPPGARADPAPARLEQAFSELAELAQALEKSEQQLRFAEERIETLVRRESRLKHKFQRLAQKAAEVRHVAYHDELTGLPNRSLLLDRFNQAVALGARQGRHVALLFLDLDGFKSVNDQLGHAAGDNLLQQVASRLSACIRACDTACRYGGDEFVVMLPEVGGHDSASRVAEKIRSRLAAPYAVEGSTITVPASIGTAVYPVDGHDYGDLIKQSDLDMYRAKTQ
jgi:diguanylate cyclase (GGDEF)-like protein